MVLPKTLEWEVAVLQYLFQQFVLIKFDVTELRVGAWLAAFLCPLVYLVKDEFYLCIGMVFGVEAGVPVATGGVGVDDLYAVGLAFGDYLVQTFYAFVEGFYGLVTDILGDGIGQVNSVLAYGVVGCYYSVHKTPPQDPTPALPSREGDGRVVFYSAGWVVRC